MQKQPQAQYSSVLLASAMREEARPGMCAPHARRSRWQQHPGKRLESDDEFWPCHGLRRRCGLNTLSL